MGTADQQVMYLFRLVTTGGNAQQVSLLTGSRGDFSGQQAVIQGDEQPAGIGERHREQVVLDGVACETADPLSAPGLQQLFIRIYHHHLPSLLMQLPNQMAADGVGPDHHHMTLQGTEGSTGLDPGLRLAS
ncbi:hypothetical protein D3C86_1195680 [compost metagenome]